MFKKKWLLRLVTHKKALGVGNCYILNPKHSPKGSCAGGLLPSLGTVKKGAAYEKQGLAKE